MNSCPPEYRHPRERGDLVRNGNAGIVALIQAGALFAAEAAPTGKVTGTGVWWGASLCFSMALAARSTYL